ncbi:hypothetical protein BH18ACI2_BH18ACI2_09830 [soil metagenome]
MLRKIEIRIIYDQGVEAVIDQLKNNSQIEEMHSGVGPELRRLHRAGNGLPLR